MTLISRVLSSCHYHLPIKTLHFWAAFDSLYDKNDQDTRLSTTYYFRVFTIGVPVNGKTTLLFVCMFFKCCTANVKIRQYRRRSCTYFKRQTQLRGKQHCNSLMCSRKWKLCYESSFFFFLLFFKFFIPRQWNFDQNSRCVIMRAF